MNEAVINPYAAPAGDRLEVATAEPARFYVVSVAKFVCLYISTFGLYHLYWNYQQWARLKRATRGNEWPVARSIFSVFFTHALYQEIDQHLRRRGTPFTWNPSAVATAVVVLLIASRILGRFDPEWATALSVACVIPLAMLIRRAQQAANAACGDAEGSANASFTAANIAWIILGVLFWLLVLLGLLLPEA